MNGQPEQNGNSQPQVPSIVTVINGNNEPIDLNVLPSEQSKGGLKYEVVLEESKADLPPKVASPAASKIKTMLSADLLKSKLEAATERRMSMEAEKKAKAVETNRKLEEAAKKREEEEKKFQATAKENLEQKLEASSEKREAYIEGMKTKLSSHNTGHLQEVKQNLENNQNEFEEKAKQEIAAKLETAEKNREKILEEKLVTLKKHDEKVELVRTKRNSIIGENGHGDAPLPVAAPMEQ